jgi:hypothetical protein
MSTIFATLIIAFIIFALCVALLGISRLITGKSRLRIGMCGRIPIKKKDKDSGCGTQYTCGLCSKGEAENKEES